MEQRKEKRLINKKYILVKKSYIYIHRDIIKL